MKTVSTEKAPAAIGPYSQAQIAGGFVFASGQIPIIPETGLLAEGLEAQAHQVFRNITAL
ncbi:MAG: RidA family protein, partial [Oscillospiraceae bacterium]|nr:RidA family protein [Oscillospiraceae bacterium]